MTRTRSRRCIAAALATAAISLAGAAQASADSIAYVKDYNVWIANPDGSGQYQVTTDGTQGVPYVHPSQADDGTIVVAHGTSIERLRQNGEVLSSIDPPAASDSTSAPIDGIPQDVAVSPDGKRVAFVYYSYGCPVGVSCGARQALLYSFSDKETPKETFGQQYNLRNPSWVSNERVLMFGGYGQQVNFDSPGGGDDDKVHWFDDGDEDLGDGELSRQGNRFAAIRSYGSNTHLQIYAVDGDAINGVPGAPAKACQTGTNESLEGPSWSPDGSSLAFAHSEGIEVIALPNVQPGDCPGAGSGTVVIAGGSEPDWGPANVNPGPRVVPFEATYDEAKLRAALKKGVTFRVTAGAPGRATVALYRGKKKVASGAGNVPASGKARMKARFTKKAKRSLARRKSVKLAIKVTYKPAGGKQQVARGSLKLKR
jgi:hypothetical protein